MPLSPASIVVLAWTAWCVLNVVGLFVGPWLMRGRAIVTNGFAVVIPDHIRAKLTDEEVAAVIAHEHGHIVHEHALKNMARLCFLVPRTAREALHQELQADDYAAARGHGRALASALLKLGRDADNFYRADRLDPRV